jgi:hypothetical protein
MDVAAMQAAWPRAVPPWPNARLAGATGGSANRAEAKTRLRAEMMSLSDWPAEALESPPARCVGSRLARPTARR